MSIKRPLSESDWTATPEPVQRYVESLEQRIEEPEENHAQLRQRIEKLENRLNQNSQNSNKPPSSDPPFQRPERERRKTKRRRDGQKDHKGHRQQMLKPTEVITIDPSPYACGCTRRRAGSLRSFYTHQWIELPEIEMLVKHVNVFSVPISTGAIQKVIDRVSAALLPVHAAIGAKVRRAAVNHVDETSWQQAVPSSGCGR